MGSQSKKLVDIMAGTEHGRGQWGFRPCFLYYFHAMSERLEYNFVSLCREHKKLPS